MELGNCPHCTHAITPDNCFETTAGNYHILCYQAACVAAGQPDPFPKCDDCDGIIWQFVNGKLNVVIRGSKCVTDAATGENKWRAARWHPECAPPEPPGDVEPEPVVETATVGAVEPVLAVSTVVAQLTDESGKPVCPRCDRTVHKSPTQLNGVIYHKTCAALVKVAANPTKNLSESRSTRPKCPVCSKGVSPDAPDVPEEKARDIMCEVDGVTTHYHRACYRRAMIAAGQPDPFPSPSKEELKTRLAAGREKAKKEKKEATTVCGICNEKVLRSAFADHVVPCAERVRAAALTAG